MTAPWDRNAAETLSPGEVHVWYVRPEPIADRQLLADYLRVLSDDERRRQQRFIFARHRHQYLVAHAFVRCLLSRYAPVPPEMWQFETNSYGRPEIAHPQIDQPLRFNLSHTHGLIACGITLARDLGVDVEDVTRSQVGVDLADRYFAPQEVADLLAQPVEVQQRVFFDYWTLKEAYIKARGMGLSIPLDKFAYLLRAGKPVTIHVDPELNDDATSWQFAQFEPDPGHTIAVAVRRGADPPLTLRWQETIPVLPRGR